MNIWLSCFLNIEIRKFDERVGIVLVNKIVWLVEWNIFIWELWMWLIRI